MRHGEGATVTMEGMKLQVKVTMRVGTNDEKVDYLRKKQDSFFFSVWAEEEVSMGALGGKGALRMIALAAERASL